MATFREQSIQAHLPEMPLYSPASSRYPSCGGIGAIIGPCIEGNRRAWGTLTNSVDDDFE
jgi:hypothetical protein